MVDNIQGTEEVLTAQEASDYLKIALSTLYRYAQKGKIPHFKMGNLLRFKKSVLNKWMEEQINTNALRRK